MSEAVPSIMAQIWSWGSQIAVKKKNGIKNCTMMKKVIDRGKRSKTLSKVKPAENISEKSRQKEVLPSHKLQDHAYEY